MGTGANKHRPLFEWLMDCLAYINDNNRLLFSPDMELLRVMPSLGITSVLPASSCWNIRRSCVCKFGEFNAYLILTSWCWIHRIDTINILCKRCYLIWYSTLQFAKHSFSLKYDLISAYFTYAPGFFLKSPLSKLPFSFVNSDFIQVQLFSSSFTSFHSFSFLFIGNNCHFQAV